MSSSRYPLACVRRLLTRIICAMSALISPPPPSACPECQSDSQICHYSEGANAVPSDELRQRARLIYLLHQYFRFSHTSSLDEKEMRIASLLTAPASF